MAAVTWLAGSVAMVVVVGFDLITTQTQERLPGQAAAAEGDDRKGTPLTYGNGPGAGTMLALRGKHASGNGCAGRRVGLPSGGPMVPVSVVPIPRRG